MPPKSFGLLLLEKPPWEFVPPSPHSSVLTPFLDMLLLLRFNTNLAWQPPQEWTCHLPRWGESSVAATHPPKTHKKSAVAQVIPVLLLCPFKGIKSQEKQQGKAQGSFPTIQRLEAKLFPGPGALCTNKAFAWASSQTWQLDGAVQRTFLSPSLIPVVG